MKQVEESSVAVKVFMNEIVKINETEYEEKLIDKHRPDWSAELERIHTYNSNAEMVVIDSFYYRRKWF